MATHYPPLKYLEQLHAIEKPRVSFEFFPPKTEALEKRLWETIEELTPFGPEYVSVTYGAGGTTRKRTHDTVHRIIKETSLAPAAHLTCVGSTKDEIDEILGEYQAIGVDHIVALRGDPPEGETKYKPHPNGYHYASDLVAGIKAKHNFKISVAAYPEIHPEASNADDDLKHLKEKMDAGADAAITQFFFDTDVYLRFLEKARRIGITAPIIPGILIVSNINQMLKFANMCGASVPQWVLNLLSDMDERPVQRDMISAVLAAEQCRILDASGIKDFHFYTLNRPDVAATTCRLLGLKRQTQE